MGLPFGEGRGRDVRVAEDQDAETGLAERRGWRDARGEELAKGHGLSPDSHGFVLAILATRIPKINTSVQPMMRVVMEVRSIAPACSIKIGKRNLLG
jgi:hypothetical protein